LHQGTYATSRFFPPAARNKEKLIPPRYLWYRFFPPGPTDKGLLIGNLAPGNAGQMYLGEDTLEIGGTALNKDPFGDVRPGEGGEWPDYDKVMETRRNWENDLRNERVEKVRK
jgi:hypothetical protein